MQKSRDVKHGRPRAQLLTRLQSVDPEAEVIQLVPSSSDARPSTIEEIVHTISSTEPRFTFCRFGHEGDREHDVLLFFFTCPSPAEALSVQAIKRRMVYPLMKRAVLEVARTDAGLSVDKTLEVENPSQIDESLVLPELDVGQSERQGGG